MTGKATLGTSITYLPYLFAFLNWVKYLTPSAAGQGKQISGNKFYFQTPRKALQIMEIETQTKP